MENRPRDLAVPNLTLTVAIRSFLVVLFSCIVWRCTLPAAYAQTESVLYTFTSHADGGTPNGTLVRDPQGNLYGTASIGGSVLPPCGDLGCGVVFRLAPDGTETTLHAFIGGADGSTPTAGLLLDSDGNLFGTTQFGGIITRRCPLGCGVVFKLTPNGSETVIYAFTGFSDGGYPQATLIQDSQGNLYGTTEGGGLLQDVVHQENDGCGVIFRIDPSGVENVLYAFEPCKYQGVSNLLRDAQGNLYGTTYSGGTFGLGTVFELEPNRNFKILHSFSGGNDGYGPVAGLVEDPEGNLFGTTASGGLENVGTVFEVTAQGAERVIYNFSLANYTVAHYSNGFTPLCSLLRDRKGNLYGTTESGGVGYGTVFELTPNGAATFLYSFQPSPDGSAPRGTLLPDASGNLYGTTWTGGAYNRGIVYRLTPQ